MHCHCVTGSQIVVVVVGGVLLVLGFAGASGVALTAVAVPTFSAMVMAGPSGMSVDITVVGSTVVGVVIMVVMSASTLPMHRRLKLPVPLGRCECGHASTHRPLCR